MRSRSKHRVVLARIHFDDARTDRTPQARDRGTRDRILASVRRQDHAMIAEQFGKAVGNAAFLGAGNRMRGDKPRSEEHTSALQSLMRISYAVFCWQNNT